MKLKLGEIAKLVSGALHGDPNVVISGIASLQSAGDGDITFLLEPKFIKEANSSNAAAVLSGVSGKLEKPYIYVGSPRTAMTLLLSKFAPSETFPKGIHKTAVVDETTRVSKSTSVGPYVVIEGKTKIGARTTIGAHTYIGSDCEIGDDVVIYPRVTILPRTIIRDRVVIWSGTVIGVDGFGFSTESGEPARIPQIGRVVIESDVEIFANCTIARATMGDTVIGKNTKLDCMVHIAHNCRLGNNNLLAAATAIAGSVTFGESVAVGGQAGFAQHVKVGDRSIVMGRAGVTKDVPAHQVVSGFPAQEHKKELELQAAVRHLPDVMEKLKHSAPPTDRSE